MTQIGRERERENSTVWDLFRFSGLKQNFAIVCLALWEWPVDGWLRVPPKGNQNIRIWAVRDSLLSSRIQSPYLPPFAHEGAPRKKSLAQLHLCRDRCPEKRGKKKKKKKRRAGEHQDWRRRCGGNQRERQRTTQFYIANRSIDRTGITLAHDTEPNPVCTGFH